MKKIIITILLLVCCSIVLATTTKAEVKGDVMIQTKEGQVYQLEKEAEISDDDTIIVSPNSQVKIFKNGNRIIIRKAGAYKLSDLSL